jgi:hypothetical protein
MNMKNIEHFPKTGNEDAILRQAMDALKALVALDLERRHFHVGEREV